MSQFTRFLAASGLANLADGIATLIWVWVASLLTRDAALIALVPVALRLPWVIFAIPAGLVADRVDRHRMVLAMDALRAAAFAVAAVALMVWAPSATAPATGVSSWPLFLTLCLAALVVGVAEVFRDNAAQTLLPALVPDQALERANGQLWSLESVTNQMLGPALGALLLGAALALPFAVNAAAYAAAALILLAMKGQFRPAPGDQPAHWRRDLAEAFRYLLAQPLLLMLACITGLWNLLDSMMMFALLLHAQENLQMSASTYGLVLSAMAIGGIIAGLTGDRVVARIGPGATCGSMLFLSAFAVMAMPMLAHPVALGACFALMHLGGIYWNIVSVSTRQRLIPDMLRGRVNSLYRLLAWGAIPLGSLLAGVIIEQSSPWLGRADALVLPLWVAGVALVIVSIVVQRPLRRLLSEVTGWRR
ncbi:MFS transporter [Gemmobacter denitrificans]|uniref:MFS transporter n=1 Tax=Gemmobacter denitrificans TaxID=3123040 RepID=A0ABU8BTV1_9RHOB